METIVVKWFAESKSIKFATVVCDCGNELHLHDPDKGKICGDCGLVIGVINRDTIELRRR